MLGAPRLVVKKLKYSDEYKHNAYLEEAFVCECRIPATIDTNWTRVAQKSLNLKALLNGS